jgi:MFS transporter, DHA1 family, multidrug resistance protein
VHQVIKEVKFNTLFTQELINCFGFFAPLSLLAIFLSSYNHIATAEVATAMLLGSLISRWSRIVLASLFNRLPLHILIAGFQYLGGVGYIILAHAQTFSVVLLALFLIGIFYGNNSLINSVLLSQLKTANNQLNEKFAALHIATNLSAGLGPLLISGIYYICGGIIAFYFMAVVLFISSIYSFKTLGGAQLPLQTAWFATLAKLIGDKKLWGIYLLIVFSWFSYAQLFSLAPLIVAETLHLTKFVWIVAAINSVVIILFSVLLHKTANKMMPNLYFPILMSFIFALLGFACLNYATTLTATVCGIILITLAEIMFIPGFSAILSAVVETGAKTAIFALNALCIGAGEGLGYYYGVNVGFGMMSTQLSYLIVALQISAIIVLLVWYQPLRRDLIIK